MKAIYDNEPQALQKVGDGSFRYRYDIEKRTVTYFELSDEGREVTQWECNEVIVWMPLSSNSITQAVLTDMWDNNYEQKLINEYNSAVMGLYDEETAQQKIEKYKEFLRARTELKEKVDADCKRLGIN